ncbi:MAG: futalosine hydrolase [Bacteroidetes bacterium]|nr:MAG: futalosine hydrolase [Bacteroidota bacterium]
MEILISAATEEEIAPLRDIWFRKHKVEFLVSGVGMVASTYSLCRQFSEKPYQLAINTGLAGAFDRSLKPGEIVRVTEDIFAELGAEDGDEFLSLKQIGLPGTDILINLDEIRIKEMEEFRKVRSITVNTVHGNETSIKRVMDRYHPHIETMEGAAFFFVCGQFNIPSLQLRSISNYVEKRNKANWEISLALKSMKQAIAMLLEKI